MNLGTSFQAGLLKDMTVVLRIILNLAEAYSIHSLKAKLLQLRYVHYCRRYTALLRVPHRLSALYQSSLCFYS